MEEKKNNAFEKVENVIKLEGVSKEKQGAIIKALEEDPRPSYHKDGRIYGANLFGVEVKFKVENNVIYIIEAK